MPDRILYLESFAGIAGDMFTAAFLDAGLIDAEDVTAVPGLLGADGVRIEITTPERSGARATHIEVVLPDGRKEDPPPGPPPGGDRSVSGDGAHEDSEATPDAADELSSEPPEKGHHHHHHHYPALVRQLQESGLGETARNFALRVFRLLAEAEAHAHGVPLEKVVFHEVGAVDSVIDVAMAGICVEALGSARIMASPVKLGRGRIRIAHGIYPVPPPASARLAVGMPVDSVPAEITRKDVELSTPTGLAILRALEPEFTSGWPGGKLLAQGLGSGTMDLEGYPNVFRVALLARESSGEVEPPGGPSRGREETAAPRRSTENPHHSLPFLQDRVVEIRCNVDDQTGERTGWIMERALELGALDGWVTPVIGKKGRPAQEMTLLVRLEERDRFAEFLLRRSSTLGVRFSTWDRLKLMRETEIRETDQGPIAYKIGKTTDGEVLKEKPEYEEQKKLWEEDPEFS